MRHVVTADLAGERLDRVVAVAGGMSRSEARALIESGRVTVDGRPERGRHRLDSGQVVSFDRPESAPELVAEDLELDVVHEDQHLLVVDKPAGLVVHPGAGRRSGTLAGGILWRYPQVEGVGEPGRWGLVHRLDKDTSGLLVVALTQATHASLASMIGGRRVHRGYQALVDGRFGVPTGTVDAPIARDPGRPTRRRLSAEGRPSRTHYAVADVFESDDMTMLDVTLETGRTHQIRVHLAGIGHPLAGDRLYRSGPDRIEVGRLFLHAARLAFDHPDTGERLDLVSPLPTDLAAVLDVLRSHR